MRQGIINVFAAGDESREDSFKLYTGIAPVRIIAINPNVESLRKIFPGRKLDEEIDYSYVNKETGKKEGIFIHFYVQVNTGHKDVVNVVESSEDKIITRVTYLLKHNVMQGSQSGKFQVINDFGETGWMTPEEFDNKTLPEYMQNMGYLKNGMRKAYAGEENLVKFIKTYLNIPNSRSYNASLGSWTTKTGKDLDDAMAGFSIENLKTIIQGNIKPISDAIKYQPNNQIKLLFGVRTSDDNKQYQDVCAPIPIPMWDTRYTRVTKELENLGNFYENTDFGDSDFKFREYKLNPTKFTPSSGGSEDVVGELPFGDSGSLDDLF